MAKLYNGQGAQLSLEELRHQQALASIGIEYGREDGADFYFIRIPRFAVDGRQFRPRVALTSADGSVTGGKISALNFAKREKPVFTLNAGLFNTSTMVPQGQTIVAGVSMTNSPMVDDMGSPISEDECYPLCIDKNGNLSAPYERSVDTAQMIADGVQYAVTGWGQFIEDFAKCDSSKYNEIVHAGTYIRQCIGQFDNGDYFVCTVNKGRNGIAMNDGGMTYDQLADLLIARGVKFAYSLDGGGSCETVLGLRQVNPVYEGSAGRAVPTVIRFDAE